MSGKQNPVINETLFSFELLVERVSVTEKGCKVSDELAIGVRLLDFPTLLIYQPRRRSDASEQCAVSRQGEYIFNKGKSCFFRMNLDSLHSQLLNSPLYAMVLDVKDEVPRLVGTSLISLAKVVARIWLDVTENGLSSPSSYGERGVVGVSNLKGEHIGSMSLSYKLLSVGTSFLSHITDSRGDESARSIVPKGDSPIVERVSADVFSHECGNAPSDTEEMTDMKLNDCGSGGVNHKDRMSLVENVHRPENEILQKHTENDSFEDFSTVFCPPHLVYNSSFENGNKNKQDDCRHLSTDSVGFTHEDSEEETFLKVEETSSTTMNQRPRRDAPTARTQSKTENTLNNVGEVIQQLPLLNALLVELSQLNDQSPKRPLSIHPNLAWIYRPASTEPSGEHVEPMPKAQRKSPQKTTKLAPLNPKMHTPTNNSVPVKSKPARGKSRPAGVFRTSPRKQFTYGTTKTFNLRRSLNSPPRNERHQCLGLIKNKTNTGNTKEKTVSPNRKEADQIKSAQKPSAGLEENVETMMQRMQVNTGIQETVQTSQKNLADNVKKQQSKEKLSLSSTSLKVLHLRSVNVDESVSNKARRQSASDQSLSETDRHGATAGSLGSGRDISLKLSASDSSGEENGEERYDDDFNSLEPSDIDSPDSVTSPESCKTARPTLRHSGCSSDSDSEGFHSKAVLPVPVKASTSPQRALMGTHIIRPGAHTPTQSLHAGDRHSSASSQIIQKQSGRSRRSPGGDSFMSSEGQTNESGKKCKPVGGLSQESVSSFETDKVEELSDELGSLDFKMQAQPISNLIANKLPGYTM